MPNDPRILPLLEKILESHLTPEEVCAGSPELLPELRVRWKQLQAVEAEIEAFFPSSDRASGNRARPPVPSRGPPPAIPGYEMMEILGHGGVGVVYKARQIRLNRPVAIKMLLSGAYAGSRERARFEREARAIAALAHPNILQLYEVGDFEGRSYFSMELLEGGTLSDKLAGTALEAAHAAALAATLAGAVHAAHQRGIIHRDLKPANILLAGDGAPKISDFGLARQLDEGPALTQSGARVGTPSYMAPEQAAGKTSVIGPSVDIYGLGALLYEMLTGRPPFRGESAGDTHRQVLTEEPVAPTKLNPRVPRDLETICLKCLEKVPQRRYSTALDLADDLGRYQSGEPIAARPISGIERAARWIRRKPAAMASMVAALALFGIALSSGIGSWRLERKRRAEIASWAPRLELVAQLQNKGQFPEARALLDRRPEVEVVELNDRISSALGQLDLAQKLNEIRSNRTAVIDGRFDLDANRARSDREYEKEFGAAGLGGFSDATSVVAARIRASPVRTALIAALDDWAVCSGEESKRGWIFEVARQADPDPSGWRDRVRAPGLSKGDLAELADRAVVQDQSVKLLVALSQRMQDAGADSTAFLRRVQQQYPGDFWASFGLAYALWGKNPAECIRYYQAALAIRPDTTVAHYTIARALALDGHTDEAIEHFRETIRLDPKFAHAVSNLGMLLALKGALAEALDQVKQAVALDDQSAGNYDRLAEVLRVLGRFQEAIDALQRAVSLEPGFPRARLRLGYCRKALGKFDEALEEFRQAERDDPTSALPLIGRAELLEAQGRIDEAIAVLERGIQLEPLVPDAHIMLGNCWRKKRSPQKAFLEYEKANELRPGDAHIVGGRRMLMVQLGLGEGVRDEWENALKAGPPRHQDWYGYAELCLYLALQEKYEQACHQILDRFGSSADPQVCERVGRACLLGRIGPEDTARAAAMVERAVEADLPPTRAWARPYFRVAQGLARYRLGDIDGAVHAIDADAAKVLGPLPHLVLSMAHRRDGRAGEAFRSLAKAIDSYDWSVAALNDSDAWMYHAVRREAEGVVLPNLAALLAGKEEPRDLNERLALIAVSKSMNRTALAASLCVEAFEFDSELADRSGLHRYDAACWAARAGTGDGEDAAKLGDEARAHWRHQARIWLRDDLAAKRASLTGGKIPQPVGLAEQLQTWLKDPALAVVRDDAALEKLPPAEREAWLALWVDVRRFLADATGDTGSELHH